MQSAIIMQPAGSIKAVIGLYPQLDMRDDFYDTRFGKQLLGTPMLRSEIVDEHVKAMAPGAVVTSAYLPSRLDIACSMMQNGRVREFLVEAKEVFPVEMIEVVDSMPAVLIVHGSEDSVVPVAGSKRFVKALKRRLPGCAVRLNVRPGDHGFDGDVTMEEEWLKNDVGPSRCIGLRELAFCEVHFRVEIIEWFKPSRHTTQMGPMDLTF